MRGLLPSHAQIALLIGQIMEPEVFHDFKQRVNATVTGDPMETALSRELALGSCMQYFGEKRICKTPCWVIARSLQNAVSLLVHLD